MWKSLGHTSEKALCLDDGIGDLGEEGLTLLEEIPAAGLLDGLHAGDVGEGILPWPGYWDKIATLGILQKKARKKLTKYTKYLLLSFIIYNISFTN